jgi:hypothetical protein
VGWQPSVIPYAISAGMSTFLVGCMDVAMLYVAGKLRTMRIQQAGASEKRPYIWILTVACILESAT